MFNIIWKKSLHWENIPKFIMCVCVQTHTRMFPTAHLCAIEYSFALNRHLKVFEVYKGIY